MKGILSGAIPEEDTRGKVQAKATGTEAEEAKAGMKGQEARRVLEDAVMAEAAEEVLAVAAEDDLAEEDKNNKFRI